MYVNFTYNSFELRICEPEIRDRITHIFAVDDCVEQKDIHIIEVQSSDRGILVQLDGYEFACLDNAEQVIFHIASIFGNYICGAISGNICVMHAASVLIDDKAVSLIGTSGKGKTTLSLLLSQYGYYIGDEYAYINVERGTIWHERHPVQIKAHNRIMLEHFKDKRLETGESEEVGKVRYIPLEFVNYKQIIETDNLKIQYLVFPQYDEKCEETVLRRTKQTDIPEAILTSVLGDREPAKVLKAFLHSAVLNRTVFLDLLFSDGVDAARELYEYIMERNRKNEVQTESRRECGKG